MLRSAPAIIYPSRVTVEFRDGADNLSLLVYGISSKINGRVQHMVRRQRPGCGQFTCRYNSLRGARR